MSDVNTQEELQASVAAFRAVSADLAEKFESAVTRLDTFRAGLDQHLIELHAKDAELAQRETAVKDREDKVGGRVKQLQDLATERKLQLEVAADRAAQAYEKQQKAEAELRVVQAEKKSLTAAMDTLLKDKIRLEAQLEARSIVTAVKEGA